MTEAERQAARSLIDARSRNSIGRIRADTPACASISTLAFVEVTLAPDAPPGPRESAVATPRGVSNPLVFHVGQLAGSHSESRWPSRSSRCSARKKLALRKRPRTRKKNAVTLPCTANGQIASGEVNRYRFEARKGQRLVFSTQARQLVPYIADAVPGWFQPVLALYDARARRWPTTTTTVSSPIRSFSYEVPKDGEYVLAIYDAIYRGREDFVYRITIGELPFVTSIFPLGGRVGTPVTIEMKGWNLEKAEFLLPATDARDRASTRSPSARKACFQPRALRAGHAAGMFRERTQQRPASCPESGRCPSSSTAASIGPDDWDVFQFTGKAGETIVAEVTARRLDSPLDSVLKLTDANGKLLAFNDDHEDPEAGRQHAPRRFLPHGQTARRRDLLRPPGRYRPARRRRVCLPPADQRAAARFRVARVPSSLALRSKAPAAVNIHVVRKDGFTGHQAGPEGSAGRILGGHGSLSGKQTVGRLAIENDPAGNQATGHSGPGRPRQDWRPGGRAPGPCRRKIGCRPSSGGIWFPPRHSRSRSSIPPPPWRLSGSESPRRCR